jgi:hypothetical protein
MYVTLSDIVADIVKNACESGAFNVELEITELGSEFRFLVKDDGKGMSKDEAARAIDPLSDTSVSGTAGFGIPFLIQTVSDCAGGWDLHTEKGGGTTIAVWFDVESVETPPVGDIAGIFLSSLMLPGPKEFIIRRIRKNGTNDVRYELRKTELAVALGGLADAGSKTLLATYLKSLENPDSSGIEL